VTTRVTLKLPWPPSVNRMWRTISKGRLAGRTLLSQQGRDYRKSVADNVLTQHVPRGTLGGRLQVWIYCRPPDERARDLDNLPKGILDGLKHAGVIHDDKFIDELHIVRERVLRPCGEVEVMIAEIRGGALEQVELLEARA
jgi:crossover junction endodeoxyribonuclease RusA